MTKVQVMTKMMKSLWMMEEVEEDGLMNEEGSFVEGEEQPGGHDDETSCDYSSSHFIEQILTL